MKNSLDYRGKVAFVTGAASGIGLATAQAFPTQHHSTCGAQSRRRRKDPFMRCTSVVLGGMLAIVILSAAQAADRFESPKQRTGKEVTTITSNDFLKPAGALKSGVSIANAAPTVDFMYYPGQTYAGDPWSVWGDGSAENGKYYSAIGDHLSPKGSPYVYEYDSATKKLRVLVCVRKFLESSGSIPESMYYTPGKIHGRVDLGSDGWLYYSTHRGSPGTTNDAHGYLGDWILRTNPTSGETEVVATHPVAKHCIPCSVLDPERMIFYGGTAAGKDAPEQKVQFFAYDIKRNKLLYSGPDGPARYMFLARSTGIVYYVPGGEGYAGPLMRFDPAKGGPPTPVGGEIGLRSATQETPQGMIYTVSRGPEMTLWSFNTKTEEIKKLDAGLVGKQTYVTSLDVDPTGRYLYYNAGAHGGTEEEGAPLVQYDLKTKQKKVIAFLHPTIQKECGYTPIGTFGSAIDEDGSKLYITWNGHRNGAKSKWDVCALTVIHIPESERVP